MADDDCSLLLPPGFRFHPTDEEIIVHYLQPKVADERFSAVAMGEVDLNSCEPWELPRKAKMGEKMWYFFCQKDRKYPTGTRTNRATKDGYWKATGKDKEIYKQHQQGSSSAAAGNKGGIRLLVGTKKTLVFYLGRAPKGDKTNWVMHEFCLHGTLPSGEEWVVCRIFHKKEGIKPERPGPVSDPSSSVAMMSMDHEGTWSQQRMSMSMSTPTTTTTTSNIHQESTSSSYFFSQMPPPNPFFSQSGLAGSGYSHLQGEVANAAAGASTPAALCKAEQASSSIPSHSQDTGISNADISSYDGEDHSSAGPLLNLDSIWEY